MIAVKQPAAPATNGKELVELPRLDVKTVDFKVTGTSPLICNRWSEKAKTQMRDKQMKKANTGRTAKDPEADFRASLYPHSDGGYGFPAIAFKAAAVRAGTYADAKMTFLRGTFHVIGGELVKINGEPRPREDMVRLQGTQADIRYRGEFPEWDCRLLVQYNAGVLSLEQLLNYFRVAGFGVGIGEWRPEKDGSFGMFTVEG